MQPPEDAQRTPVPRRPRGHLLIPRLDPDVDITLEPADESGPRARFVDDREPLELGDAAVVVLSEVDGQRHHIDIARSLSRKGLQPSDPDIVATTLLILAAREILHVSTEVMDFEMMPGTRHRCLGCGRSCEGWSVGHIPDEEAERLLQYHAELSVEYPELAKWDVFELDIKDPGDYQGHGKKAVRYLHFPYKRCIFLSDDRQCLIHRHYGSEAKPRICQQFPVVATEADQEVRVGIRPHCFRLHKTFEGDPDASEPDVKRLRSMDIDSRRPPVQLLDHRVATAELRDAVMRQEISLLRWLQDDELTLAELVYRVAGHEPQEKSRNELPPAFVKHIIARLVPLKKMYTNRYYRGDPSVLGESMRDFLDALEDLENVAPKVLTDQTLPDRCWRYLAYCMTQVVFLRSNSGFPTVFVGAMVMAIGALGVTWSTRDALHEVGDEDPVPDVLGERFAAWFRTFSEATVLRIFPSHDDYQALLAKLSSG